MIKGLIGNPLLEAYQILIRNLDVTDEMSSYRTFFSTTWTEVDEAVQHLGVQEACGPTIEHLKESMLERPWPSELGDGSHIALHEVRRKACTKFAWAVPSEDALEMLAKHGPIVEIGAGTGYWAALLASRGVDIVCYDGDPPVPGAINHWHEEDGVYYPVHTGGPEMAAKHADRTLFLCWPPYAPEHDNWWSKEPPPDPENWERKDYDYQDGRTWTSWKKKSDRQDLAFDSLMAYEAAGGQKVIYVGEGNGGCTAGPSFHARIGQGCDHWGDELPCTCPQARWEEIDTLYLPQWDGIHDNMYIYEHRVPELMPAVEP